MGELKVLSSVDECVFEKEDVRQTQANGLFSMGQIGFNSLDTVLLVQVIKFNNILKSQGSEFCFARGVKTSLMKGRENQEFTGVPTLDNLKRWVKEGRKEMQTKAPWDILETSQEGSAIVFLYRQEINKELLTTLETVNNALEQNEIVRLDCSKFKSFCRKMQGGKKLPLIVILEQTKQSIITLTNMNTLQLTEVLNEQSNIVSHPDDETETNDFVLQAPDNEHDDSTYNPITPVNSTEHYEDVEVVMPTDEPYEEGVKPVLPDDGMVPNEAVLLPDMNDDPDLQKDKVSMKDEL